MDEEGLCKKEAKKKQGKVHIEMYICIKHTLQHDRGEIFNTSKLSKQSQAWDSGCVTFPICGLVQASNTIQCVHGTAKNQSRQNEWTHTIAQCRDWRYITSACDYVHSCLGRGKGCLFLATTWVHTCGCVMEQGGTQLCTQSLQMSDKAPTSPPTKELTLPFVCSQEVLWGFIG